MSWEAIRFRRAVDLWDAVKIGTDFGTLLLAINAAWQDNELVVEECIALFANCGYATRACFDYMAPTGWLRMRNVDKDCWQIVAAGLVLGPTLAGRTAQQAAAALLSFTSEPAQTVANYIDQGSPFYLQTPARRASEQTPALSMAEADQAFADLAELVK